METKDKKLVNFRLSVKIIDLLNQLSKQTGKSKTQLVEEAILKLANEGKEENKQLDLLEKQNQQLQQALQGFQLALQGKDELLKEKDERIKDLQETIKALRDIQEAKHTKKPFWKFWG